MKTFTAKEVFEVCEKIVEDLRASVDSELQLNSIQLGYLILFAELTILQYAREGREMLDIPEALREDEDEATSV